MMTDETTDPPLDAAQRLGLARFRLGPDAPPWLTETLAFARDEVARLTRERDAARAALRDASRCDSCGAWATRYHHASASYCCDSCGVGNGWTDDSHAVALRAARVP